jgi:hypothetical protein
LKRLKTAITAPSRVYIVMFFNGAFMKRVLLILAIAVVHLVFTKVISIIALSVVTAHVHESQLPFIGRSLMVMSKVLYFPVITFAWYPRQFFPGNFVIIPLFINSLLWAVVIYVLFVLVKRIFVQPE